MSPVNDSQNIFEKAAAIEAATQSINILSKSLKIRNEMNLFQNYSPQSSQSLRKDCVEQNTDF